MSDLTSWFEQQIQEWWADGADFPTPPTNIYIALHTGDPGNDASANEVTAGDYSRAETQLSDWSVSGSAPTNVTNSVEIQFDAATSSWGTISHISLWTSTQGGGGNPIWEGDLNNAREIQDGDRFVFPADEFDADLD